MIFKEGSYILKVEDICEWFLNILYAMCRCSTDRERISRIITNHMELRVDIVNDEIIDTGGLTPPDTYFHRAVIVYVLTKLQLI